MQRTLKYIKDCSPYACTGSGPVAEAKKKKLFPKMFEIHGNITYVPIVTTMHVINDSVMMIK